MPIAEALQSSSMDQLGPGPGKAQTHLPWDTGQAVRRPRAGHLVSRVFRTDGQPYKPEEVEFIRKMTGKAKAKAA